MKISCKQHGVHFDDDFFKSLRCGYWKERGLEKLPLKHKKLIWDWIYSTPVDQIWLETDYVIKTDFIGEYRPSKYIKEENKNEFVNEVKDYKDWTDKKRRDYQRNYFKKLSLEVKKLTFWERIKQWLKKNLKY